jgi:serine phosphatase RsbU (regulator of sigma subunit)
MIKNNELRFYMKLSTKFIVPYLIVFFVATALFSFAAYKSYNDKVSHQILEKARNDANKLAEEVTKAYPDTTIDVLQMILDNYIDLPDVVYVVLFSLDRSVNFPMYKAGYNTANIRQNIFSIRGIKDYEFERKIDFSISEDLYEITIPVIVPKIYYKELGSKQKILILSEKETGKYDFPEFIDKMEYVVKYAVTLKDAKVIVLERVKLPILIFSVVLIFILAMVQKYDEYLLKPLYKLLLVTEKLDKNNKMTGYKIKRRDELGILSKNIYDMHEKSLNSINNLHLTNEYAQSLISSPSISSLFNSIVFEVLRLKDVEKGGLMYWNEKRRRFVVKETKNFNDVHKIIANDENFIRWYLENRVVLDPENFLKNFNNYNKAEVNRWKEYGIEAIIPMFQHEKVVGFINLGRTKNLKEYTLEDINFFRSLSQIAVIAVENLNLRLREARNIILKKDLEFARGVQKKLLPNSMPIVKGAEFALSMSPARNIGGDYYDFIKLSDNNIGIGIADVSGKGVSAALVMASTRSYLRLIAKDNYNCRDILNNMNKLLIGDTNKKMFVTMFYSILNMNNNKLQFANAGHNYPLVYRSKDKNAVYIQSKGFPLGVMDDFDYNCSEIKLELGDIVVYYTDGIIEALNDQKELFGFSRLESILNKYGSLGADEFVGKFNKEFSEFIGDEELNDDYTILVVKIV